MLLRCPDCSTGFRLSDERIGGERIKVRCTNCEHVFKAGIVDDGAVLFDTSDERLPEPKQLASLDGEDESLDSDLQRAPATTPGETGDESGSGDDSYNPFPHAGDEARPSHESAISGSIGDPSPRGGETEPDATSGGEREEPHPDETGDELEATSSEPEASSEAAESVPEDESEGAVSLHPEHSGSSEPSDEGDSNYEVEKTAVREFDRSELPDERAADEPAGDDGASEVPSRAGRERGGTAIPSPSEAAASDSGRETADESDDSSRDAGDPDDARRETHSGETARSTSRGTGEQSDPDEDRSGARGDPSESDDGAGTDDGPDAGSPGPPGSGASAAGPPPGAAPPPGDETPAAVTGAESTGSRPSEATRSSSPPPADPDVDDSETGAAGSGLAKPSSPPPDTEDLALDEAEHFDTGPYRSSGLQTASNVLLVVLLAASLFVVFAASQNNWLFDFERIGQMARVALQGAEYEAPDELTREVRRTVEPPAPENPIEFRDVFIRVVPLHQIEVEGDTRPTALVLKGKAENVSKTEQRGVEVRGIIYDKSGKVIAQATAPLGPDVPPDEVASAPSMDRLANFSSGDPDDLPPDSSRTFTVVFSSVPDPVLEGANVDYRVEVADKSTPNPSDQR